MFEKWRKHYLIDDETAASLWESIELFVRPQNIKGDEGITSVIIKSMLDEIEPSNSLDIPLDSKGYLGLEQFLGVLDKRHSEQLSIDHLERGEYLKAVVVWLDLIDSEFFDPRHPFFHDKPYYRALVISGICQVLLGSIQGINSGAVRKSSTPDDYGSALSIWVERILVLCERIVGIEPFDPELDGYFKQYSEGAFAQNHNAWVCLSSLSEWFNGWSSTALQMFSDRSPSNIEKIISGIRDAEILFRGSHRT